MPQRGLGPKRKRNQLSQSKEEHSTEERLVRQAATAVRRDGKIVKQQETQKLVRRLKQQREQFEKLEQSLLGEQKGREGEEPVIDNEDSKNETKESSADSNVNCKDEDERNKDKREKKTAKAKRKIAKLEQKLQYAKDFNLDILVKVCMKRVGLAHIGVDIDSVIAKNGRNSGKSGETRKGEKDAEENDDTMKKEAEEKELVESMLLNKKLTATMDSLDAKVTEYRRNVMKKAEGEDIVEGFVPKRKRGKDRGSEEGGNLKKPVHKNQQQWSRNVSTTGGHDGPSSLFIESLSGKVDDENIGGTGEFAPITYNQYGPGGGDEYTDVVQPAKKNRMGQRARKAKAMAEEARRQGRKWDGSLNWREKKKPTDSRDQKTKFSSNKGTSATLASGLNVKKEIKASQVADMGKTWKEEGSAHPSWAAKQHSKNQSGIAQFAGKKITFD